MAVEIARLYAREGANLALLGRFADQLASTQQDLEVRGAGKVVTHALDLATTSGQTALLSQMAGELGLIDVLVLAYGVLGDQERARSDGEYAKAILETDFTSAALWMIAARKHMNPAGTMVVFSSVAGDRGRKSNYVYGSAKAGLAVFAQGLAHDMAQSGPRVLIVKPGFVSTAMTAGMNRSGPLWAKPEDVARRVVKAVRTGKGPILYAPWFWRWIMLVIRLVPASIFHRTNL